jgi:hypothetical protein
MFDGRPTYIWISTCQSNLLTFTIYTIIPRTAQQIPPNSLVVENESHKGLSLMIHDGQLMIILEQHIAARKQTERIIQIKQTVVCYSHCLTLDRWRTVTLKSWRMVNLRKLYNELHVSQNVWDSSIVTASWIVSFNGHSLFRVVNF